MGKNGLKWVKVGGKMPTEKPTIRKLFAQPHISRLFPVRRTSPQYTQGNVFLWHVFKILEGKKY